MNTDSYPDYDKVMEEQFNIIKNANNLVLENMIAYHKEKCPNLDQYSADKLPCHTMFVMNAMAELDENLEKGKAELVDITAAKFGMTVIFDKIVNVLATDD